MLSNLCRCHIQFLDIKELIKSPLRYMAFKRRNSLNPFNHKITAALGRGVGGEPQQALIGAAS